MHEGDRDGLDDLADFVSDLGSERIPGRVLDLAKLQIADSIGVILSGSAEPEPSAYAFAVAGDGEATIVRKGFPAAPAESAATANALAMGFLELDEGAVPAGHPALHVLPALLAEAQAQHAGGERLITAFVAGYEAQGRLQAAARFRYQVHPHGHLGSVAAAAGLAKLQGHDADGVLEAMCVAAGMMPITLWMQCTEGATVRNAFAAQACRTAFFAASLARAGFTGSRSAIVETFNSVLGTGFDMDGVARGLGTHYAVDNSYIKLHSCCGLVHPIIEAILDAFGATVDEGAYPPWSAPQLPRPEAITRVTVHVAERALRLDVPARPEPLSARFSIPFGVAAFLATGDASPRAFTREQVADPAVHRFASRVRVVTDDALTKLTPHHNPAAVEVELTDGRTMRGRCIDALGTPARRLSPDGIAAKFCALSASAVEEPGRLWSRLMHLDSELDCRWLFRTDHAAGPR